MVKIELMKLTEEFAIYRYHPENSDESGIVSLNRKTGERELNEVVSDYGMNYAAHALRRIGEYQRNNEFLEKDIVAWY